MAGGMAGSARAARRWNLRTADQRGDAGRAVPRVAAWRPLFPRPELPAGDISVMTWYADMVWAAHIACQCRRFYRVSTSHCLQDPPGALLHSISLENHVLIIDCCMPPSAVSAHSQLHLEAALVRLQSGGTVRLDRIATERLVLAAARDHFYAADALDSPGVAAAQRCLALLPDSPAVRAEGDAIAALLRLQPGAQLRDAARRLQAGARQGAAFHEGGSEGLIACSALHIRQYILSGYRARVGMTVATIAG